MTTDYVSALLNKNLKSMAAQNRVYTDVNSGAEAGMFDSVFENVTKNYADKSEIKTSNKEKSNYAAKTKDVANARKSSEDGASAKSEKNLKKSQTEYNKNTSENVEKKASFTDKKSESLENTQEAAPSKALKDMSDTTEQVSEKRVFSENSKKTDVVKEKVSSSTEFSAENKQENTCKTTEIPENVQPEQFKNEDLTAFAEEKVLAESTNQITNEQILANIGYELPVAETVLVDESIFEFLGNNEAQIASYVQNSLEQNLTEQSSIMQNGLETVLTKNSKAVLTNENISKTILQNAVSESIPQEIVESVKNNFAQELIIPQMNLQEESTQEVLNQSAFESDTELEVDVKNADIMPKNAETEARQKNTVQQSLAADNSRLLVNIESAETSENSTILDELPLLTPTKSNTEETTDMSEPMVQVTEKVAREISSNLSANLSNSLENKDISGSVKDKITAKLGEIDSTSTLVTEVQNSSAKSQSAQTGSDFQGNTSLSQGNAAEQAVKMSIEDASGNSSSDSFMSQLEAKLNASTKALNAKQPAMLNKSDIMSQLNVKLNEMQNAGQSKVSMILQPESLGRVSIEIINSKDGIIAKMTTDSQQVKELFDKNIEALRSSLSSQGVNVNNIKVECTNQSENNAMDFERQQFEQNAQDFGNSQGRNNHANHANQGTETAYFDGQSLDEDAEEPEIANAQNDTEIQNTVKHNGKIDYKV